MVPKSQEMYDWFNFIEDGLKANDNVNVLIVDFNEVDFLHTDDFVVLACLIESFSLNGASVAFIGGTAKFNAHLENIKFKFYWSKGFNREEFTISRNKSTLCLWKISHPKIPSYSNFAKTYFERTFLNNIDLLPLASNLDEVFNNIFDHSKSPIAGYIITQYFPIKKKLSFSVCDFGIGIANSINSYRIEKGEKPIDDWKAISLSLEQGFSVKSTPQNRGFGLNNILELTESSNGTLSIVSNEGILIKRAGKNYEMGNTGFSFSGTLIKVEVDTNTFENIDESDMIFDF